MGHIQLARDERNGFFAVPVMVIRTENSTVITAGKEIENLTLYLDTGSSMTSIGQTDAERLGISLTRPTREDAFGIGGLSSMPVIKDFKFWILDESSGPVQIRLSRVAIVEDAEEAAVQSKGGFRKKVRRRGTGIGLFGMDSLDFLKATLTMRVHEGYATLDW